ncbi:MAG: lysylphosphatidylglycerol synthase transmembrane domain-containing protein [Ilumatobacteraceae bacterium]
MSDDDVSEVTADPVPLDDPPKPSKKKAFIAIGIAIVVAVIVFGVIFPQLVDWDEVFEVLRAVDAVELVVIFGLGALRWVPAGWIYALVLPGLSLRKGTQAWVATTGVGSTLPGFDLVLRVGMYRSWGFPIERTMSGMFLSGIVEMSTRLILAITAVLMWGLWRLDLTALAIAGIAAVVVAALAFVLVLILRSEEQAERFGHIVHRYVHWVLTKFKRQAPEDLVDRILSVRLEARKVLGTRWPQAFLAAFLAQLLVYLILLLSIRAVGIESDVLSWADVLIAYAITTIVTSIPISPGGVGIAELTLVAVFTAIAGQEISGIATAGVLLYRLSTWLLPIPVGWLATLRWQSTSGVKMFGGSASTPEPSAT